MSVSLVQLLIAVVVFGLIWRLIALLPVSALIKQIAEILTIIIAICWLLNAVGMINLRII